MTGSMMWVNKYGEQQLKIDVANRKSTHAQLCCVPKTKERERSFDTEGTGDFRLIEGQKQHFQVTARTHWYTHTLCGNILSFFF